VVVFFAHVPLDYMNIVAWYTIAFGILYNNLMYFANTMAKIIVEAQHCI